MKASDCIIFCTLVRLAKYIYNVPHKFHFVVFCSHLLFGDPIGLKTPDSLQNKHIYSGIYCTTKSFAISEEHPAGGTVSVLVVF